MKSELEQSVKASLGWCEYARLILFGLSQKHFLSNCFSSTFLH